MDLGKVKKMIDLTKEQTQSYAIFGVSPERYEKIARVVNLLPHKWLVGRFSGKLELSALLPLDAFLKREAFLMEGQESWLKLGPANHRTGTRPAALIYPIGKVGRVAGFCEHLPPFRQVHEMPIGDFSFDPETGAFYATPDER